MQRDSFLIPVGPGEICAATPPAQPWATWTNASVLRLATEPIAPNPALPILAWSGSLAELDSRGLFDDDPRTWGPKGWAALEHSCTRLTSAGLKLLIRPHARHVISDIPGCKRLLESDWAIQNSIRLVYDPWSMCSDSMIARGLEDHLRRMYEAIPFLKPESLAAVVVGSHPPHFADLIHRLIEAHLPPGIPLLTPARGLEPQG